MNKCVVLYHVWQMHCCGTPFHVDEVIEWPVLIRKFNISINEMEVKIDYLYESHSFGERDLRTIEGKVIRIDGLYHEYKPSKEESNVNVSVSDLVKSLNEADGRGTRIGTYELSSYIVFLEEVKEYPSK